MEIPEIYLIIFWSVIAFILSKAIIPVLLYIAKEKHLFDDGNDHRKLHEGLVPTLGGVAIFTAFLITFSASSFADQIQGFGYFVSASCILLVAGLKDDLIVISSNKKFAAEFLASGLIVFGCNMQITNLGGVFGVEAITPWIGIPITIFTMIVVINSYNLIDGIDGLGGTIGVFVSGFFGFWFYVAGLYAFAMLSFVLLGTILGFLWYNRPPAKIFMGDTGSLLIGFLMSVLAINYVEYSMVLPNVVFWQPAAPIVAAAVMAVPLYDTLRIFIIRASRGKSPFKADKDHIHHHMLELGLSQGQVVISLLALNLLILSIIIISSTYLSNTGLLVVLLGSSMLLFPTNRFKRKLVGRFVSEEWDNLVNENGKVAEDKNEKTIEIIEEDQKEYSSSTEEINKGKMKEKLEKV